MVSRLLISQPTPASDKSPFADLVGAHGTVVDFRPLISVKGVSLKEFIAQRVKILDHTAVVFTSRTLVDNFFRLVGESRLSVPDTMKYFCVSESIANYLQKYIVYRKRKIFYAENSSVTALLELILKHASETFLLPLSEPYQPEVPLAMERASLKFSKAIFSRAECTDLSDLDPNAYGLVALYTPAEVESFQKQLLDRGYTGRLAVFGGAVARAAMERGLKVDVLAPTAQYPSMSSALSAYIDALEKGESVEGFAPSECPKSNQEELLRMAERRRVRTRKSPAVAAKK